MTTTSALPRIVLAVALAAELDAMFAEPGGGTGKLEKTAKRF